MKRAPRTDVSEVPPTALEESRILKSRQSAADVCGVRRDSAHFALRIMRIQTREPSLPCLKRSYDQRTCHRECLLGAAGPIVSTRQRSPPIRDYGPAGPGRERPVLPHQDRYASQPMQAIQPSAQRQVAPMELVRCS